MEKFTDIGVEKAGHVTTIEIQRPPLNFFDVSLINQIADALTEFDNDTKSAPSVLAAQGKAFCAGANFGDPARQEAEARARPIRPRHLPINHLYVQAVRIFRNKKPIVAAVHGAAIGGGLGLAVSADFRVTCPEARFAANFTKLGFHPGFGLTATLPELVGKNNAELIFYTSRRDHRRGSHPNGPRQCLRAAGPGPRRRDEARRRDRRMLAARPDLDPRHHARRPRRPRAGRHQP